MKGGVPGLNFPIGSGGAKRSKTSNCHCGLPSCMKCRRGRKSRRQSSKRRVKVGGSCDADPLGLCGGRRRGRPCKSLRRRKTRKNKTRKMRR